MSRIFTAREHVDRKLILRRFGQLIEFVVEKRHANVPGITHINGDIIGAMLLGQLDSPLSQFQSIFVIHNMIPVLFFM